MKSSKQRVLDKLAKSNKRSTSVKHKVDLSNITELEDHVEFVLNTLIEQTDRVTDAIDMIGESMGNIDGLLGLAKDDLDIILDMQNAISDLGIDIPENLLKLENQLIDLVELQGEVRPAYDKILEARILSDLINNLIE